MLRSPAATSGFIGARYREALPEGSAARTELGYRINFLDPPDHTRVRHHVGRAWTPRRVADLRGWVEALAERLLDEWDVDRRPAAPSPTPCRRSSSPSCSACPTPTGRCWPS